MSTDTHKLGNQQHPYPVNVYPLPNPTQRSPFPFLLYILLVIGYALFFSVWQFEIVPQEVHLVSTLIMATCSLPLLIWYMSGRQGLPIFEMICLSYLLQFSIPIYTQSASITILSQPIVLFWSTMYQALLYVEAGLLAFILSYYLFRSRLSRSKLPMLELRLAPRRRTLYIVSALLIGGFVNFYLTFSGTPSESLGAILRVVSLQMNIGLILLASDIFSRKERRPFFIFLFCGATALSVINGLITGLLENVLVSVVALLLVYWHATHKIPWLVVISGMLLVITLNSAKSEYRRQVWFGRQAYTISQRIEIWENLILQGVKVWIDPTAEQTRQNDLNAIFHRFDLIHKFTYFVQLTPAIRPYYNGKSYSYFLSAWVPRVLWPGKPIANGISDQIEIDYHLKLPRQPVSQGLGQLPEGYINFGPIGVVVVMAIQGALFAIFDLVLNRKNSEGGRAIYLAFMIFFLNGIGSVAAILWGALIQNIAVSAFILRYFSIGSEETKLKKQTFVTRSPAMHTYLNR